MYIMLMFICLFYRKDYPVSVSPKQKVYEWTVHSKKDKAVYVTVGIFPHTRYLNFTLVSL